jgi:hypothetical protein
LIASPVVSDLTGLSKEEAVRKPCEKVRCAGPQCWYLGKLKSSVRQVVNKGKREFFPYTGLLVIAGENNVYFYIGRALTSYEVLTLSISSRFVALERLTPKFHFAS